MSVFLIGVARLFLVSFATGPIVQPFVPSYPSHPPPVGDAEVEDAVDDDLFTAGAARLQRPAGVVQPDVDPLDEVAGNPDVVPLHKEDLAPEPLILAGLDDLFDQILPHLVVRMGLAGKDDMDGAAWGD